MSETPNVSDMTALLIEQNTRLAQSGRGREYLAGRVIALRTQRDAAHAEGVKAGRAEIVAKVEATIQEIEDWALPSLSYASMIDRRFSVIRAAISDAGIEGRE